MKIRQCVFRNGNKHTNGWVDAKKVKTANRVQLLNLGEEFWDVIYKGAIKDSKDVHYTFSNNI